MMIRDLAITNFRQIRHIHLRPNALNIFVGPNNTGKSSILQAISLLITSHNKFYDSINQNMLEYMQKVKRYDLETFINYSEKKSEIRANFEQGNLSLKLGFYTENLPQKYTKILVDYFENYLKKHHDLIINISKFLSQFIKNGESEFINIQKELEQTIVELRQLKKLFFERAEDDKITSQYVLLDKDFVPFGILKMVKSPRRFFDVYIQEYNFKIKSFFGDNCYLINRVYYTFNLLIQEGKINKTIQKLKEKQILEDIRFLNNKIVIFRKKDEKPIFLSSMGDGFITLLDLVFMTTIAENGIIIYDEPDTLLHPYYIDIVSKTLIDSIDNIQFFISTHNIEFIEELLKYAKEKNKLDAVCIYRLHYRDATNQINIEEVDGYSAYEKIEEIGLDLRLT